MLYFFNVMLSKRLNLIDFDQNICTKTNIAYHVNTFYEKLKFFSSYQKITPIKLSLSKIKIISYWKEILFFFYTTQKLYLFNKQIVWYLFCVDI